MGCAMLLINKWTNLKTNKMGWTSWHGKRITRQTEDAFSDALFKAMEAVGGISDQQVPHDEGTLQESKTIMKDPNDKLTVYIGYGGGGNSGFPEVPYAKKWHEIPANFQKGRKHNYLRDPIKSNGVKFVIKELNKTAKEVW